jgi:hypothetical protein
MNLPQIIVLGIVAYTWRRHGRGRAIAVAMVAITGYVIGALALADGAG